MSWTTKHEKQLHALLWALRDGRLTEEQAQRLERLVCESDQARRRYIQYLDLFAGLYWCAAAGTEPEVVSQLAESLIGAAPVADDVSPRHAPAGIPPGIRGWTWQTRVMVAITVAAIIGLGSLAAWLRRKPAANSPLMEIVAVDGAVQLIEPGARSSARRGGHVHSGQSLRTGPQSSISLRYADGTELWAGASTSIIVGTLERIEEAKSGQKQLFVERGEVAAVVTPQPRELPMLLATPSADVTVRGTDLALEVTSHTTRLEVTKGRVELRQRDNDNSVVLQSNEFAVVAPPEPLITMPIDIDPGDGPASLPADELPAFPGAEGFGAVAVGGRGGRVIKVTNLNSDGPGSLRAACEAEGPRIVVFNVAGVIHGDVPIRHSYITIAGQTAPSPGITVAGRLLARSPMRERLHDIIVRFLRFRMPPTTGHSGDTMQLPKTERVILDHLSLSWANDEAIDLITSSEVTVQWCALEESDTSGHSKGVAHNHAILCAYRRSGNISIHHNLLAHHDSRCPSLSPYAKGKPGDFRNNVVYDFRAGLSHDGHRPASPINLVGNYYKRGPSSQVIRPFGTIERGQYYIHGNVIDGLGPFDEARGGQGRLPRWVLRSPHGERLATPARVASVTTHMAQYAYRLVLARAGCFPRDRVSQRTIEEVKSGTGKWGRNGPAAPADEWFLEGMAIGAPPQDSDGDALPDGWEDVHGLNKADRGDVNTVMPSGYTAIEEYLNHRAAELVRANIPHTPKDPAVHRQEKAKD